MSWIRDEFMNLRQTRTHEQPRPPVILLFWHPCDHIEIISIIFVFKLFYYLVISFSSQEQEKILLIYSTLSCYLRQLKVLFSTYGTRVGMVRCHMKGIHGNTTLFSRRNQLVTICTGKQTHVALHGAGRVL